MNNNSANFPGQMDQFEIGGHDGNTNAFVGSGPLDSGNSFQNNTSTNINNNGQLNSPPPTTWYGRFFACFHMDSLQQYFDVDTVDVKERIVSSILHANQPDLFRESILHRDGGKGPDLYGPVWLCMTLVLFLAITGNTSKYLHTNSMSMTEEFEYDISHLFHALWVLVFYTFVLPVLLYIMLRCVGVGITTSNGVGESISPGDVNGGSRPLSLIDLVCIYGYSLVSYIPATILCMLPSVMLEWMILIAATCVSLLLVLRNVMGPIVRSGSGSQWVGPVTMCLIGCHFIFLLVLKLVFYHHKFSKAKSGGNSSNYDGDDGVIATDDAFE